MTNTLYKIDGIPLEPITSITLGFFDGCHLGHQKLLLFLKNLKTTFGIITFQNHPNTVLPAELPPLLSSKSQRLNLLKTFHPNLLWVLPFNDYLANLASEDFITLLHNKLHFKNLVLGHDSKLGKNGLGNAKSLESLAKQLKFQILIAPIHKVDNIITSSNHIRYLLSKGDLEQAEKLLGRPLYFENYVHKGLGLGKSLGFPTINLPLRFEKHLIPYGVYAGEVTWKNTIYPSVINIGKAPTINRGTIVLEAHIPNFKQNLYNQKVKIRLKQFLRPENKFPSHHELIQAIQKDIDLTLSYFSYAKTT